MYKLLNNINNKLWINLTKQIKFKKVNKKNRKSKHYIVTHQVF